ncbi:hypothetical protein [Longimicrobium sp.]|uniref:hypothetical protein n=1 Tax=Longimicrobium sp. TaxID=2029185 RepID=UPI003B3B8FEC
MRNLQLHSRLRAAEGPSFRLREASSISAIHPCDSAGKVLRSRPWIFDEEGVVRRLPQDDRLCDIGCLLRRRLRKAQLQVQQRE